MLSLNRCKIIGAILSGIIKDTYHYTAPCGLEKYIVWAEDGEATSLNSDNAKTNQAIQGTIDLFTKEENDIIADEIQKALIQHKISFSLNSIQYEDETEFIHYEWVWSI